MSRTRSRLEARETSIRGFPLIRAPIDNLLGLTVENQIFGVANASNQTGIGIMGFGPSPFGFNNSGYYPFVVTSMAKQGLIKSPAFSLDLRDYDNSTGSIIFGGLDKKKFSGSLAKIPFITQDMKGSKGQTFPVTRYVHHES
jgi:hypothetical protein